MSRTNMFNFHLDEKFNLKEDIKLGLTNLAVYIPIVLAILLELVVLQSQLSYSLGIFSSIGLGFLLERVLLPVSFLYVLRRILVDFKPAKPKHVWTGMGHFIMPAIYFTFFYYLIQHLFGYIAGMFMGISWVMPLIYALLYLLLDTLVVVMAMGDGSDMSFISDGIGFFANKFVPIILVGAVRYYVLTWSSDLFVVNLLSYVLLNTLVNYLTLFVIVLIYLRSSRQIVMRRGLYRYTQ